MNEFIDLTSSLLKEEERGEATLDCVSLFCAWLGFKSVRPNVKQNVSDDSVVFTDGECK